MAKKVTERIGEGVAEVVRQSGGTVVPQLVVVQVGADPASSRYLRMKERAAGEVGMLFQAKRFDKDISVSVLLQEIRALNADPGVHGVIVQLPLPAHIPERVAADAVAHAKDVDGLHISNVGALARGDPPLFLPCTPKGVMLMLDSVQQLDPSFDLRGKSAVVVGRSNIVGKPVAQLLLQRDCTTRICHSRTVNIQEELQTADIVVVAVGRPHFLQADWIKPGAVVIDVGINSIEDAALPSGERLVGDVHPDVASKAFAMSPVPGGVGPVTVAMLLQNTLEAAQRQSNR